MSALALGPAATVGLHYISLTLLTWIFKENSTTVNLRKTL